ncbi:MAG: hypothetical protein WC256_07375 [Desulfurivibrionaceae bacterium]|jgi:hypothetical protein
MKCKKNYTAIILIGGAISLLTTIVNIFVCIWLLIEMRNFHHFQTTRLADHRFSNFAGRRDKQGALTLFDKSSDKGYFEIGAYNFGWTFHTPDRIVFHTGKEVSISS